jgi:hypothetical protein
MEICLISDLSYNYWGIIKEFLSEYEIYFVKLINRSCKKRIEEAKEVNALCPFFPKLRKYIWGDYGTNSMELFDLDTKLRKSIPFHNTIFFGDGYDYAITAQALLITGGNDAFGVFKRTLEVNLKAECCLTKSEMHYSKYHHTFIPLNQRIFYTLGGKDAFCYLNACEEYSLEKDEWEECCHLTERKAKVSCTSFDGYLLFAFGGHNGTFLSTIEKMNLKSVIKQWNVIQMEGRTNWTGRRGAGCVQISKHSIMVFGGECRFVDNSQCFTFNLKDNTMQLMTYKLQTTAKFYQRKIIFLNSGFACKDSKKHKIHFFNLKTSKWKQFTLNN